MAKEAEEILGDRITQGFVVTHQPTPFHLKKITSHYWGASGAGPQ